MKLRMVRMIGFTLAALLLATDARAQWDAPSFLPPRPGDDIGIYLSSIEGFGLQGIWRQQGNMNLGLRIGYIDKAGGQVLVAAETWGRLMEADVDLPVDVTWTLGAGAVFNGGTDLEVPAGLSIGRVLDMEPLTLQIYAHPRLALFFRSQLEDELDLDGLFDLGLDAVLNENLKLRFGATLGQEDALGIGVAYRWSRGAVVR